MDFDKALDHTYDIYIRQNITITHTHTHTHTYTHTHFDANIGHRKNIYTRKFLNFFCSVLTRCISDSRMRDYIALGHQSRHVYHSILLNLSFSWPITAHTHDCYLYIYMYSVDHPVTIMTILYIHVLDRWTTTARARIKSRSLSLLRRAYRARGSRVYIYT